MRRGGARSFPATGKVAGEVMKRLMMNMSSDVDRLKCCKSLVAA